MTTRASWIRRLLVWVSALLAVMVLVLWAMAPACICWWLRARLPWRLPQQPDGSEVVITTLTTAEPGLAHPGTGPGPDSPHADLEIEATPHCLRGMLQGLSRRWVPPGIVRVGQSATGTCRVPELTLTTHTWRVTVTDREDTPAVWLTISSQELNDFLAAYVQSRFEVRGHLLGICHYQVDAGTIEDDGTRVLMQCGQKVTARGRIIVDTNGTQMILEVRRLVGSVHWRLVPGADGTRLTCKIHFDQIESDDTKGDLVAVFKPLLFGELEVLLNNALSRSLAKVVMPSGIPQTLAAQVQILGTHPVALHLQHP